MNKYKHLKSVNQLKHHDILFSIIISIIKISMIINQVYIWKQDKIPYLNLAEYIYKLIWLHDIQIKIQNLLENEKLVTNCILNRNNNFIRYN